MFTRENSFRWKLRICVRGHCAVTRTLTHSHTAEINPASSSHIFFGLRNYVTWIERGGRRTKIREWCQCLWYAGPFNGTGSQRNVRAPKEKTKHSLLFCRLAINCCFFCLALNGTFRLPWGILLDIQCFFFLFTRLIDFFADYISLWWLEPTSLCTTHLPYSRNSTNVQFYLRRNITKYFDAVRRWDGSSYSFILTLFGWIIVCAAFHGEWSVCKTFATRFECECGGTVKRVVVATLYLLRQTKQLIGHCWGGGRVRWQLVGNRSTYFAQQNGWSDERSTDFLAAVINVAADLSSKFIRVALSTIMRHWRGQKYWNLQCVAHSAKLCDNLRGEDQWTFVRDMESKHFIL